jgi:hypothetical protein
LRFFLLLIVKNRSPHFALALLAISSLYPNESDLGLNNSFAMLALALRMQGFFCFKNHFEGTIAVLRIGIVIIELA